jgi:transposase
MKTFEELKEELLIRAKNAGACQLGYAMGLRSNTRADLLKAITDNWFWVLRDAKIVDARYLEDNFTEEELSNAGIYTKKYHEVRTASFACGSATVKAYDSATVKAYDSATVKAYDSATVEAYDSATVEAYDSATVKAYDSATVEAYDSATVKAYDNSYIEDYIGNIRPESDYAIVKDYHNHKIYIKKGQFEIIEV